MTQDHTNRLAIEPGMFDAADALTLEAAMQEKAKVEQTLILGAPKLLDMLGVGSFSLPIPGTDPVRYVAAGTLAEIERVTRGAQSAPIALPNLVSAEEVKKAIKETEYKYFGCYEFDPAQHGAVDVLVRCAQQVLASLAPVAAEPVRQVPPIGYVEDYDLARFQSEGKQGDYLRLYARQNDRAKLPLYAAPQVPTSVEVPSQWISVEDRLPDDDCRVLAATWFTMSHDQHQDIVSFRHGTGKFSHSDVTHWMPLPAAPSVEVKGEQGEMGGAAPDGFAA